MRLEAVAARGTALPVEAGMRRDGKSYVVDTVGLFAQLVDLAERNSIEDVAAAAQSALADGVARAALAIAAESGIRDICFSGGVAYNDAIASTIRDTVESAGMRYRVNEQVPCGDGGISLGQAACAGRGIEILEADRTDTAPGDHCQ